MRTRAVVACVLPTLVRAAGAGEPAALRDAPPNTGVKVAENARMAMHLPGADPLSRERFNVSLALMHDPERGLM